MMSCGIRRTRVVGGLVVNIEQALARFIAKTRYGRIISITETDRECWDVVYVTEPSIPKDDEPEAAALV